MIEEKYLDMAINIRRTYIDLLSNMSHYESRAKSVKDKLESAIKDLENIENKAQDRKANSKDLLNQILKVIDDVEEEGTRLEKLIEPINIEIEKLGKEEADLYALIVNNHPNLTEDQIVNIVRKRLINEGLL